MSDFYGEWLGITERNEKFVEDAPRVARHKDLVWVRTRQDAKAALMIAPELGFPTGGSMMMRAEIPAGWHTGLHSHGEEAIYVESGNGFMLLDGKRYDFGPGTLLHVPYRSRHQLFNTGDVPVGYLSGLAWHLEASVYMGRMDQFEDCGENDAAALAGIGPEESQYWPEDHRRISMHQDQHELSAESKHGATYFLMGRSGNRNGFKATAAAISSIFVELPRSKSHSHARLLYVVHTHI